MNPHYHQNYTKEQIEDVLFQIKDCIRKNQYIISRNGNRQANNQFISHYRLSSAKQKKILLQIQTEDFCHTLQNTKPGFTEEVLYVFCPQVRLSDFEGKTERVDIYIKFNVIDCESGRRTVVISFHKRNKPITYVFR